MQWLQQICSGNRRSGCSKSVQEEDTEGCSTLATKRGAVDMGSPDEKGCSIKSDCNTSQKLTTLCCMDQLRDQTVALHYTVAAPLHMHAHELAQK